MAQGSNTSNRALVKGAESALDQFKYEVASELGLNVHPGDYWGDLPARQCGAVGGQMVKKMIQTAEQTMASRIGR